jgi:peroxiredoxin
MSQMPKSEEVAKPAPGAARKRYYDFLTPTNLVLTLAAVAGLFFLVLYSRANVALKRQNEILKERVSGYTEPQIGDAVPPLESTDLKGEKLRVAYETPTNHLLFIFTTHCPVCLDQLPAWNSLAEKATSKNYVVLGISVDSLEETKASLDGKIDHLKTVVTSDPNILRTYRINKFPMVMIISNQGVVEWVHAGKLSEEQLAELTIKLTT